MTRFVTFLYLIVASTSGMAVASDQAALESKLKKVFDQDAKITQRGVHVVRVSDGKEIYGVNQDSLLTPASVSKIVISAAILAKFGPSHTFKTRVFHSGKISNGVINGNLYIKGDGDPFVISEKLWQFAADMRHLGIKSIKGDIVIDGSLFDEEGRDESRKFGKKGSRNAYDAPVSAFGVNFNTVAVAVAPGDKVGSTGVVNMDPYPVGGIDLDNKVATAKKSSRNRVKVTRKGFGRGKESIHASGSIDEDAGLIKIYRSIGDYETTPGEYVRSFLGGVGIAVSGKVKQGRVPRGADELIAIESYPLRKMIQGLNTFSNNYIADVLLKRLGAAFPQKGKADADGQGTYENGLAAVNQFLKKDAGIKGDFTIVNGSGLSTENRFTARQITELLVYMEQRMDVFPEFLGSLPASGLDGTLRRRFASPGTVEIKGLVRAKTGTLTDPVSVSGLAGYFRHKDHGLMAFCILDNGIEGEKQPAIADLRETQDEAMSVLQSF